MSPNSSPPLLEVLHVASPCTVAWEAMEGGDVVRFCSQCELNVYNLSAMPAEAAEQFLSKQAGQGRTCVRFYRRHDGTVITRDCPVGLAAVRAQVKRAVVGGFTLVASLVALLFAGFARSVEARSPSLYECLMWKRQVQVIQGSICAPPPAAKPTIANPPATMGRFLPPKPVTSSEELRDTK